MHGCQQQEKEICCSIFLKAIAAILSFVVSSFTFNILKTYEKDGHTVDRWEIRKISCSFSKHKLVIDTLA